MRILGWSLGYWFVCIMAIAVLTLDVPPSIFGAHVAIYASLCLVIYAIGLFLFVYLPFRRRKQEEEDEKIRLEKEINIKRFTREKFLRQKYRTLKLDELIVAKDINIEDKLILLEAVHGYTPEKAKKLLAGSDNKEKK